MKRIAAVLIALSWLTLAQAQVFGPIISEAPNDGGGGGGGGASCIGSSVAGALWFDNGSGEPNCADGPVYTTGEPFFGQTISIPDGSGGRVGMSAIASGYFSLRSNDWLAFDAQTGDGTTGNTWGYADVYSASTPPNTVAFYTDADETCSTSDMSANQSAAGIHALATGENCGGATLETLPSIAMLRGPHNPDVDMVFQSGRDFYFAPGANDSALSKKAWKIDGTTGNLESVGADRNITASGAIKSTYPADAGVTISQFQTNHFSILEYDDQDLEILANPIGTAAFSFGFYNHSSEFDVYDPEGYTVSFIRNDSGAANTDDSTRPSTAVINGYSDPIIFITPDARFTGFVNNTNATDYAPLFGTANWNLNGCLTGCNYTTDNYGEAILTIAGAEQYTGIYLWASKGALDKTAFQLTEPGSNGDSLRIDVNGNGTGAGIDTPNAVVITTDDPLIFDTPDARFTGVINSSAPADYSTPFLKTDSFQIAQGCNGATDCNYGDDGYAEVAFNFTGGDGWTDAGTYNYVFASAPSGNFADITWWQLDSLGAADPGFNVGFAIDVMGADGTPSGLTSQELGLAATILVGATMTGGLNFDAEGNPYRFWGAGSMTIDSLASTGSATGKTVVCADANGKIYRSSSGVACAN